MQQLTDAESDNKVCHALSAFETVIYLFFLFCHSMSDKGGSNWHSYYKGLPKCLDDRSN